MNTLIKQSTLAGKVYIPSSKSMTHRYLICAALAKGKSIINNVTFSDDIYATLNAVKALGASYEVVKDNVVIKGISSSKKDGVIDCKESGSTIRFLIPVALVFGGAVFKGRGRLMERPFGPYFEIFNKQGIYYNLNYDTLEVSGNLKSGIYEIDGDISSQFISGLLFAFSMLKEKSEIIIKKPLQSKSYVDMTISALETFGVKVINKDYNRFIVTGNTELTARNCNVEGDYSQAAFFLVGNFLGNDVEVLGLSENSIQGDKMIKDVIKLLKSDEDLDIDVSEIPDLVPIIAVGASLRAGKKTTLSNASRLRLKESDRLESTCSELRKLGADIKIIDNSLYINGKDRLTGGEVQSHNDHRIAMAMAIAATGCNDDVLIKQSECVTKSYPGFWHDYKMLGGNIIQS